MKEFDFVVVGSGIAGLSFALKAAQHGSVAVITKRKGADSSTAWAQGGIACVTSDEDSFELHVRDTLEAGAGLCDEKVVRTIVTEAPEAIRELMEVGVHFDERDVSGHRELDLGREGGHSKRRVLHVQDVTGREIENKLLAALGRSPHVQLLENHTAIDLITAAKLGFATEDRCLGLYSLDEKTGEVETIRSDRVVLATGGCGKVYLYTTNPAVATGDGVAMAWRAGVAIANMEFVQFHPTCLFHAEQRSFLISEALRGEGGILRDARGEDFMPRYHPRGSLAPRDVVARAIDAEIKRSGAQCVYLDITHKSEAFLRERFPHIFETCLQLGIDMSRQPIPVVPAAHYQCGGIKTDINGASNLRGLYAIGEVGCTGLHGANRLASNSLLEGVVVARRACEALVREFPKEQDHKIALPEWSLGQCPGRGRTGGDLSQLGRDPAPDVGLRRGSSVRQTPAARSLAFAESPARNPRILLEFQGLGRPARTEESGDGGGPDRGQRPTAQREPGTALYPGLSADGRSAFSARYRAVAWLNTWNGYCCR